MRGKVDPWWYATAALLLLLPALVGCQRADTPPTYRQMLQDTSERQGRSLSDIAGAPIYVDPVSGCQYVGYMGHGVTPRMSREGGNYHQMGCGDKLFVNPVTGK